VVKNQAGVINVKKILTILITILLFPLIVEASKLPGCGYDTTYFHNCIGSKKFTDGSQYSGGWKNDQPHGTGHFRGKQSGFDFSARGEFAYGEPNGLISFSSSGEKIFYGEGNDEDILTFGIYYFNKIKPQLLDQGDIAVGEFKNFRLNGKGTLLDFSKGILEIGIWKEGKLVEASKNSIDDHQLVPYADANERAGNDAYIKSIDNLNRGDIQQSTYWLMTAARNNHELAIKKYQSVMKMRDIIQNMSEELKRRSDYQKKYVSTNTWLDSGPTDKEVREAKEYLQSLEQENTFDQNMKKVMTIAAVAMALGDDAATAFNTAFEAVFGTNANNYDGPCPCPYSIASDGSQCGKRSAYTRTGGAAPACY
jgi:hypothetical protein